MINPVKLAVTEHGTYFEIFKIRKQLLTFKYK
jgi:hypothetical protein